MLHSERPILSESAQPGEKAVPSSGPQTRSLSLGAKNAAKSAQSIQNDLLRRQTRRGKVREEEGQQHKASP